MVAVFWLLSALFWATWVVFLTSPGWLPFLVRSRLVDVLEEHRRLWVSEAGAPRVVRVSAMVGVSLALVGVVVEGAAWVVVLGVPLGGVAALALVVVSAWMEQASTALVRRWPGAPEQARRSFAAGAALRVMVTIAIARRATVSAPPSLAFLVPLRALPWMVVMTTIVSCAALPLVSVAARRVAREPETAACEGPEEGARRTREQALWTPRLLVGLAMLGFGALIDAGSLIERILQSLER